MKRLILVLVVVLALVGCTNPPAAEEADPDATDAASSSSGSEPVIFIHGGAVDDYVAYLLLTTVDDIDLKGTIVTNTDSVSDFATQGQWRIQTLLGQEDAPMGLSAARGWNPFPWLYRSDSVRLGDIEMLAETTQNAAWPPYPSGDELLREVLSEAVESDEPVTVLCTCPMTTLADTLREDPELEAGIARLVWIGGAIDVPGNLDPSTIPTEVANPEAEWNVFFDPEAVEWVFENTDVPIVVLPLDVTDQAKLTDEFKTDLAAQAETYEYSRLVDQAYGLTAAEPFYEMWNTAATAYIPRPDLFEEPTTMELLVVTQGYSQGAMREAEGGREAAVVLDMAEKDSFYEYVLSQFKRDFDD
jgi:purine nucleosidase